MAANYRVVFSNTTQELRGGTRQYTVRTVGFRTIPSDVYAEMRLDMSLIDVTQVGPVIAAVAQTLEDLVQRPDVAGVAYLSDVNAVGQLVDRVLIVVQTPNGAATDEFEWALDNLNEFVIGPVIADHVATLEGLLGL